MPSDQGKVVTVDGVIDPENLGVTLVHEHTFSDLATAWFDRPDSAYEQGLAEEPVALDNRWYTDQHHFGHKDNLRMSSFSDAVEEMGYFHQAGGDTVVDVTPKNVGEDPQQVRAVSRETGLNFVHGTAYYVKSGHPDHVQHRSVKELTEEFISDITDGIGNTMVRAGIIGEIGLSGHLHDDEVKVLRAAGRAGRKTGAPVTIHPAGRTEYSQRDRTYPRSRWGLEIVDILEEEGLPPNRVIMGHMDGTIYEDLEYQFDLVDRGVYIAYDLWGTEKYLPRWNDGYPSDTWRVESTLKHIERGNIDRLLFSHDIGSKTKRQKYGGHGYSHILMNVVPRLLANGLSQDQIETIIVENPRRVLPFDSPEA